MTFTEAWVARHSTDPIINRKARFVARQIRMATKDIQKPVCILDVGCASGVLVDYLNESGGFVAEGIDTSRAAIAYCKKHRNGIFHYGELDGEKLGKYDAVVATHVLEHIQIPAQFLYQVRAALQPWGKFIVVVPNLWAFDDKVTWRRASKWLIWDKEHVAQYSPESITAVLSSAGFTIEKVYSHTYPALMMRGCVSGFYRKWKHEEQRTDCVSPERADWVDRVSLATEWAFTIPAKISERGCRGGDLVVIARGA